LRRFTHFSSTQMPPVAAALLPVLARAWSLCVK
jgi:hypothetical protein